MNVFYKLVNNRAHIYVVNDDLYIDRQFKPYFYIDAHNEDKVATMDVVVEPTTIRAYPHGGRLVRVVTRTPAMVARVREMLEEQGVRTYEADIPFATRYIIDKADEFDISLNRLNNVVYIDIEVMLPDDGFPYPERAEMPVICVTCYNTKLNKYTSFVYGSTDEYDSEINVYGLFNVRVKQYIKNHTVFFCDTEEDMLNMLTFYLDDIKPGIITGWNVRGFDMLYLYNRMNNIGVDGNKLAQHGGYVVTGSKYAEGIDIKGVWLYDLLKAYMRFKNMRYYPSLKHAAEVEGIDGKMDININEAWKNDINRLIQYNKRDVEICVKINEKYRLIDADLIWHTLELSKGIQLDDALVSNKLADIIILRRAKKLGYALPSKKEHKVKNIAGAVVYAKPGLYNNVAVFDFKSMYPNIVRFFNIGLDTKLTCDICGNDCVSSKSCAEVQRGRAVEVNGIRFVRTKKAFVTDIIDELLDIRQQYKNKMAEILKIHGKKTEHYKILDRRQTLIKFFINAFSYGVMLYRRFRLTDKDIGSTITYIGRELNTIVRRYMEKKGFNVVLGDTDSIFVQIDSIEEANRWCEQLNHHINGYILNKYGIETNFKLEFEKYYSRLLVLTKKRYAGYLIYKDGYKIDKELSYRGIEMRRQDAPAVVKDFQDKLIRMVLNGATTADMRTYIDEVLKNIEKYDINYIAKPGKLDKPVSEYKTVTDQVSAVLYARKYLKNSINVRERFMYTKVARVPEGYPMPPRGWVAWTDEHPLPEGFKIDVNYVKTALERAAERILSAINLNLHYDTIDNFT